MEKMQRKIGSSDDAFQQQMQTKREAILDNWQLDDLTEDNSTSQEGMDVFW